MKLADCLGLSLLLLLLQATPAAAQYPFSDVGSILGAWRRAVAARPLNHGRQAVHYGGGGGGLAAPLGRVPNFVGGSPPTTTLPYRVVPRYTQDPVLPGSPAAGWGQAGGLLRDWSMRAMDGIHRAYQQSRNPPGIFGTPGSSGGDGVGSQDSAEW